MIYSIEIEKQVLASLIQYPQILADIAPFVNETDFSKVNRPIYNILASLVAEKGTANTTILSERLNSLGISIPDLDIGTYIEALSIISVNPKSAIELAKELKLISVRRELAESGRKLEQEMKKNTFTSFEEVIKTADNIYNSKINLYHQDQSVTNIFAEIESLMTHSDNDNNKELVCPYPAFHKCYGGFRPGNVYCFASRSGQGKSTVLADLAYKTANIFNKNVKVLYLDTEMQTREVMPRLLASISGVPFWLIDSGKYRNNQEAFRKVKEAMDLVKKENYNFHHKYVGNIELDALISLIKRWYLKECGRGEKALIIYDYLKILEADRGGNLKEYESMGDKMNALKACATELDAPLLTAVQINRSGINTNRPSSSLIDDESVISISDRIQWFVSYMGIFRRKVPEEIQEDGAERGTHKLITLKTRFQGEFAAGHQDLVKIADKTSNKVRYVSNFVNFNVSNFAVEERGSLRDYANQRASIQLEKVNDDNDDAANSL